MRTVRKCLSLMTGKEKGQSAVEFVLVLPFAMLLIFTAVGLSISCVRGIVAHLATTRAARAMAMYDEGLAAGEMLALVTPPLFQDGSFEQLARDGSGRMGNEEEGVLEAYAISGRLMGLRSLTPADLVLRESPIVPALEAGLSDAVLRGGDTPSPYCRAGGGYGVCGYPAAQY